MSSSTEINNNEASTLSAIKDQAVGAVKEVIGSVLGNTKMELEGKAQKVHGKNEYVFAKAGDSEPEKFQQAYHPVPSTHPEQFSQSPAEPLPAAPAPSAPTQPLPPPPMSAQPAEPSQPSQMSAWKDQAVGSFKETLGTATNNTQMELSGKAQQMHGHNEAEFAKARKEGYAEPQHYSQGTKTTEHAQGTVEGDKVSSLSAMKDRAVGSVKETFGSATGNLNTELAGKAQQMHGRNEAEFAKAQKQGLSEPEHYAQGTKVTEHAEGQVEGQNVSTLGALKDKTIGSIKETLGSVTGNQNMELLGKAQNFHGRNEAEFVKAQKQGLNEPEHFAQGTKMTEHAEGQVVCEQPSTLSGWKDQAVGAVKETWGSATNNHELELIGKAQNVHGRNEAEFSKAQKQGLNEPEHFVQGTKTTEHAQGTVEGDKVSSLSAMKDRAVGSVKETFGSATGNLNTELAGKAQQMHGKNEAEFAKAQKQGLNEPEHYAQGTKVTQHAQGQVVGDEPSKMSGWKDQAVGAVKETFGSATNNQKMELEGKAQKFQGSNQAAYADADKNTINA